MGKGLCKSFYLLNSKTLSFYYVTFYLNNEDALFMYSTLFDLWLASYVCAYQAPNLTPIWCVLFSNNTK